MSSVFVVLTMSKQFTNVPGKLKVGHFTFSITIIRSDHNIIALYRNLQIKMVYIPLNYIPTKRYMHVYYHMMGYISMLLSQCEVL